MQSANPPDFARIQMNSVNQCPMLTGERLCRIHAELGAQFLGQTCADYPRVRVADGVKETVLAFSCPEAARMVLLNPQLLWNLVLRW